MENTSGKKKQKAEKDTECGKTIQKEEKRYRYRKWKKTESGKRYRKQKKDTENRKKYTEIRKDTDSGKRYRKRKKIQKVKKDTESGKRYRKRKKIQKTENRYRKQERKGKTGKSRSVLPSGEWPDTYYQHTATMQSMSVLHCTRFRKVGNTPTPKQSWQDHNHNPGRITITIQFTILAQALPSPYNHKAATGQPLPLLLPVTGFKNPITA